MSRAAKYAKLKPRDLSVPQVGSPHPALWFVDEEGRLRVDNAGPFDRRQTKRIMRWLERVFGDREE